MSHLNSVRVPATVIISALLVIILLSSTRTTYRLAPAEHRAGNHGYALAACTQQPVTLIPPPEPRRACPWPRRQIWAHSRAHASAAAATQDEAPPEH